MDGRNILHHFETMIIQCIGESYHSRPFPRCEMNLSRQRNPKAKLAACPEGPKAGLMSHFEPPAQKGRLGGLMLKRGFPPFPLFGTSAVLLETTPASGFPKNKVGFCHSTSTGPSNWWFPFMGSLGSFPHPPIAPASLVAGRPVVFIVTKQRTEAMLKRSLTLSKKQSCGAGTKSMLHRSETLEDDT